MSRNMGLDSLRIQSLTRLVSVVVLYPFLVLSYSNPSTVGHSTKGLILNSELLSCKNRDINKYKEINKHSKGQHFYCCNNYDIPILHFTVLCFYTYNLRK